MKKVISLIMAAALSLSVVAAVKALTAAWLISQAQRLMKSLRWKAVR